MPQGQLFINNKDAYTTWGVSMDNQALSALMTPAGQKELVTNQSRLAHGKRVINSAPRMADRDLALTINLVADTEAHFFERYLSFCQELAKGRLEIVTSYQSNVVYRCDYISCNQFAQFMRGVAKFSLKLNEPNPNNRQPAV